MASINELTVKALQSSANASVDLSAALAIEGAINTLMFASLASGSFSGAKVVDSLADLEAPSAFDDRLRDKFVEYRNLRVKALKGHL